MNIQIYIIQRDKYVYGDLLILSCKSGPQFVGDVERSGPLLKFPNARRTRAAHQSGQRRRRGKRRSVFSLIE